MKRTIEWSSPVNTRLEELNPAEPDKKTLPLRSGNCHQGWKKAMQENNEIKLGASVIDGKVCFKGVADTFDMEYVPVETFL